MKIKHQLELGRLIAKIDNDFNISESDWIPRVAAWVHDALSQMSLLPRERKRRTLEVSDGIAQFPCMLDSTDIRIFDSNGCEIPEANDTQSSCYGGNKITSTQEIAVMNAANKTGINFMEVANIVSGDNTRNFVVSGNCIHLNFNADTIDIESNEIATYYDEYYDTEVPYIYDNGLLLEALAWYCLFKYLSRGSKHQVYDLKSNSPVTNPWIQWNNLKAKAAASVRKDISKEKAGAWRSFFYNMTFNPRG